jgi:hypothetical protein
MSRTSSKGSLAAAAVFIFLTAGAVFAGLSGTGSGDWSERGKTLEETRRAMLEGARFHKPLTLPDYPESGSFCRECHPSPPHPGGGVGPAFLNHHAASIECLVCHWSASEGPPPDLEWSRARSGRAKEETGARRHFLGLSEPGGGMKRDLAAMRGRVVSGRACFERGTACRECHRQGGMTRYARPGNSPREAAALEKLPDFLTLSRGARWYFPQRR